VPGIYRPRHPERTALYRVLFHNFDRFLSEYEIRFEKELGYFRPIIQEVVERYLDCGNPRSGFALMIRYRLMRTAKRCPGPVSGLSSGTAVDVLMQDPRLLPVVSRQAPGGVGRVGAGDAAPGCAAPPGRLHDSQDAEDLLQVQAEAPRGALPVSRQDPHGLF
jgi:hypothetical protein